MTVVVFCFAILAFLGVLVSGNGDIYIVVMQGEPVVNYRGGVEGFVSTAPDSDEKIDVTR